MMIDLLTNDPREIAYQKVKDAIQTAPLGRGTGMNTGASRFAFIHPDDFHLSENYYAKVIIELGIPGLLVVVSLFASIIWFGFKVHGEQLDSGLRSFSSATLAVILIFMIYDFKGWITDLDPINVYFWILCGFLFKLGELDAQKTSASAIPSQHEPVPAL